jgi:signal transduction histidine kinase
VLLTISSIFFLRSILTPVRQISGSAKKIARGDFNVRVKKKRDDEIGQLCDTINDMAAELQNSEQMKNDFISSVSHELRTPLTAIKGWAETLQSGDLPPDMFNRGMGVIIHESERLSGLVEELLDFSRMQNGRMVFNMEKIDVLAELGEAVYTFKERALREEKYLLYDEPETISPIRGDANRLRQVFINIIDNAMKYTQKGGTVRVTISELYTNVHVVISDNGTGIPAEHLPNVKRKFYKANQQVRGSGIGLAVSDEIVQVHGGLLEVESTEGEGTAVTITLPVLPKEVEKD